MLAIAFTLGIVAGIVIVIAAIVAILLRPVPERTEAPRVFATTLPNPDAPHVGESNAPLSWPRALRSAPASTWRPRPWQA
jgi:hypothetical protein